MEVKGNDTGEQVKRNRRKKKKIRKKTKVEGIALLLTSDA